MSRDRGGGAGSFNLCNLPPWVIASRHFAEDPQAIEVQGVREQNRSLFTALDALEAPVERGALFNDYVSVKFQLHQWQREATESSRRSIKNSYLRFLRGWGVDSCSCEGAVLKGWVESRMGIGPTFHHARIEGAESEAYARYAYDRMRGHARTNAIDSQLDLLYTFTQYELRRRHAGERWLTLWRGTCEADAERVLERPGKREWVVRMNNLASFTDDPERAWEFGSKVFEARVPVPRVFFASDLLPNSILKGEREVLVIGGELRVKVLAG